MVLQGLTRFYNVSQGSQKSIIINYIYKCKNLCIKSQILHFQVSKSIFSKFKINIFKCIHLLHRISISNIQVSNSEICSVGVEQRSQECFVNSGSSSEERIAKYTSSPPGHVFAFVFHFILHAWGRSSEYAWSAMRRAGQSFIFPFTFDSDPTTHKLSFPLLRKL